MAVRNIAGLGLSASLSSLTIASSECRIASACQADTVYCDHAATGTGDMSSRTKVNEAPAEDSVLSVPEHTTADSAAASDVTSNALSPTGSDDVSEAVSSVLCLLHALSHCSYHEPSLLVLAQHSAYDVAADLFVYLWHQLHTSPQQPSDKMQACILDFVSQILCLMIENMISGEGFCSMAALS